MSLSAAGSAVTMTTRTWPSTNKSPWENGTNDKYRQQQYYYNINNNNNNYNHCSSDKNAAKTATIPQQHELQDASESEVDAYAQKVLEEYAAMSRRAPSRVDDSLGAYVANEVRSWCADNTADIVDVADSSMYNDVTQMQDYQALCELLQEHCHISNANIAKQAMQRIAQAVLRHKIPAASENHVAIEKLTANLSQGLQITTTNTAITTSSNAQNNSSLQKAKQEDSLQVAEIALSSPLAADALIPLDLLEDPPQEPAHQQETRLPPTSEEPQQNETHDDEAFPPLSALPINSTSSIASTSSSRSSLVPKKLPKGRKGAKGSKNVHKADDLAAALFIHPRSRQSSIDETALASASSSANPSPNLQALQSPLSLTDEYSQQHQQQNGIQNPNQTEEEQQIMMMTIHHCSEILMSMSPDLAMGAAFTAADMCHGNVAASQFLVHAAATAPPVCRHLLHSGCYRADCQFSHDVESHTCMFWLRGRCSRQHDSTSGKNHSNACRFLHGFHPKLMHNMPEEYWQQDPQEQIQQFYLQQQGGYDEQQQQQQQQQINSNNMYPPQYEQMYSTEAPGYPNMGSNDGAYYDEYYGSQWQESTVPLAPPPAPNSFATIATQGYNTNQSFANAIAAPASTGNVATINQTGMDIRSLPTAKIPLDLWNPHENRDSSAFHIPDPMERYFYVVSRNHEHTREDVIDLHFQSLKTFPVVLDTLLSEAKRSSYWIVTGTGHHVGSQTHQKGGGALENAVLQYLVDYYSHSYTIFRGKDRNGQGGAVFIQLI